MLQDSKQKRKGKPQPIRNWLAIFISAIIIVVIFVGLLVWTALPSTPQPFVVDGLIVYEGQLPVKSELVVRSRQGTCSDVTAPEMYDVRPDISPDGKHILFARSYGEEFSIHVMDIDGENVRQLITHGTMPAWSPDGTQIAFMSTVDTNDIWQQHLYVMNADGSNVRRITTEATNIFRISWSPDGTQLVFDAILDSSQPPDIYIINLDGSNLQNLTANFDYKAFYPTWSPDGTRIAFSCTNGQSSYNEICVLSLDSQQTIQITNNDFNDWFPVWLPDSSGLLYLSQQDTNTGDIYAYNFVDKMSQRITWNDYDIYKLSFDFTNK